MAESAKSIIRKSEKLIKKYKSMPQGNALKIEDIYLPLNHLFNAAAKHAFEETVKELKPRRQAKYDLSGFIQDEVRYFGSKAVGERKIFDAAQRVANQVNFYADRGFVTGVLTKLSLFELFTEPHQLKQYIVVSFVAMSPAGIEFITKNPSPIEFEEGAVPSVQDQE